MPKGAPPNITRQIYKFSIKQFKTIIKDRSATDEKKSDEKKR